MLDTTFNDWFSEEGGYGLEGCGFLPRIIKRHSFILKIREVGSPVRWAFGASRIGPAA